MYSFYRIFAGQGIYSPQGISLLNGIANGIAVYHPLLAAT